MRVEFKTRHLEYLFETPIEEIRGKLEFPREIVLQYKRKIHLLKTLNRFNQITQFKSLRFEYLKGKRKGECSIPLNDQFRLIFKKRLENEIEIIIVNDLSKHYE